MSIYRRVDRLLAASADLRVCTPASSERRFFFHTHRPGWRTAALRVDRAECCLLNAAFWFAIMQQQKQQQHQKQPDTDSDMAFAMALEQEERRVLEARRSAAAATLATEQGRANSVSALVVQARGVCCLHCLVCCIPLCRSRKCRLHGSTPL